MTTSVPVSRLLITGYGTIILTRASRGLRWTPRHGTNPDVGHLEGQAKIWSALAAYLDARITVSKAAQCRFTGFHDFCCGTIVSTQNAMGKVQCAKRNFQCAMCNVHCAKSNVQCAM